MRVVVAQPLDDDVALEPLDAGGAREKYLRHAAVRETFHDLIPPELLPHTAQREASLREAQGRGQTYDMLADARRG